ncbi:MAG: T9SS type A sorting domain-containing protein [Balneolaceae bacterium]
MKRILLLIGAVLIISGTAFGQSTIYSQDFETDLSGYSQTPSQSPSSDPGDQYFSRAEPSDSDIYEGAVGPYTNVTNSWLFVGSNPNTINGGSPGILSLDAINVSGFNDLEFSADWGGVPSDWDASDEIRVEYNFDGGSWSTLYSFSSSGTNLPLNLADNAVGGDNTANGTTLTYALQSIVSDNFTTSGSESTLNIRIVVDAGANYEAFGLDNIIVTGTASGGSATKLAVTAVNGGDSPTEGATFSVTVQAQDGDDNPANVSEDVDITLTKASGTGSLGGTLTGTISNGSNSITISGVTFDTDGSGISITAADDATNLTSGTSSTFSVLEAATKLVFEGLPSVGFDDTQLSSFTVEAQRSDDSVDDTYDGTITISKSTGTGSIDGTLSVAASEGVATFDSVIFDASDTYTISATDGSISSSASSDIVINDISTSDDLFFSEYIEGSSNNKALEIYNASGAPILFNGGGTDYYIILVLSNASGTETWADANVSTFDDNAFFGTDSVYVIGNSGASASISDVADETSGATFFNGNDPVALVRDVNNNGAYDNGTDIILDVIGEIDGTMSLSNVTLVRKNGEHEGSETYDSDEWTSNSEDTFSFLGSHTAGPFATISGTVGWRLLSLPIADWDLSDISDDTPIQGVTGGSNTSAAANVYTYDASGAWEVPATTTTEIPEGTGIAVYFFDNTTAGSSELPVTLGATGSEPSSDVVVDMYSGATGRYTLVGNPFASNVDIANVSANIAVSSNMTFWDNTAGSYTTENISGGLVIQPWQGYWVQTGASTGGGQLTYGTADKTSSAADTTHFDKANPNSLKELRFSIESSYNTEKNLTLQVASDASEGWDTFDLLKLNSLLTQNVSAAFLGDLEGETVLKGIEAIPSSLEREITIPIMVDLKGDSQTLKMSWSGVTELPDTWTVTLHDYVTEESFDLRSANSYDFEVIVDGTKEKMNPLTILSSPLGQKMKLKSDQTARFGLTITPNTNSVNNEPGSEVKSFALDQNYPNPFNPTTTINYSVENTGAVTLSVYNLMGQKVAELVNETKSAGSYNVTWNASQAASGMYYYRLEAGGQVLTRKMTLIK